MVETMSVRRKALLILALTLTSLLVGLYIPLRMILLNSFAQLEEQGMRSNIERVQNALSESLSAIDRVVIAYAAWDDSYEYVAHPNEKYVADNFINEIFINNRFNIIAVVDASHTIVYSQTYDLVHNQMTIPSAAWQQLLTSPILQFSDNALDAKVTGIVQLPEGAFLIAARPIITSAYAGPVRGTWVAGRQLDAAELEALSTRVGLKVNLFEANTTPLPPEATTAFTALAGSAKTFVQPLNTTQIAGYALLSPLNNGTKYMFQVLSPRDIYAKGQTALAYFTIALLLVGLLFAGTMMILMERIVLSPLSRLSFDVHEIGATGDPNARLQVYGKDEIARLGEMINVMLADLQQAEAARQLAEQKREQIKHDFISTISHELRTPLTPISGYIDILLTFPEQLTSDQQYALTVMKANSNRLTALVSDLLDAGRLDSGKLTLRYTSFSLPQLIGETLALLEYEYTKKQLTVITELANDLPMVEGDPKRIGQIISNLLSNAIKYTHPNGTIWIRSSQPDPELVAISIEDTGVGMSFEQQRHIFTRFYRGDNELRAKVPGVGLGLSIAKSLIELHGGEIQVSSVQGQGSTFTFTLPIHQIHRIAVPAQAEEPLPEAV